VYDTVLVGNLNLTQPYIYLNLHSSWIAWFPLLFYSTIYIGDLYKRTAPTATTDAERTSLDAEATRLGSRALFYSSLLSLLVNVALPAFVPEAAGSERPGSPKYAQSWWERICRVPRILQIHLATLWAVSHLVFAGCMFATL
jgi:solute carrier family 45 protein 1/2/4